MENTIIEELNILKENLNKTQVENIKLKTQNEILTIQLQKYIQQIKQDTEKLQNLEIQMEILCKDNQKQNEQHKNDKRQTESTKENLNFQEQIYNITEQIKQVQLQQQTNHQQNQIQQDQSEYDQLQWSESSQTQVKSGILNSSVDKNKQQQIQYVEKKDFEELLKKVNDLQMQNIELQKQINKSKKQKDELDEQTSKKIQACIIKVAALEKDNKMSNRNTNAFISEASAKFKQLGL